MPKARRVFLGNPEKNLVDFEASHKIRRDFFLNEIRKKFALRVLDAWKVLNFFATQERSQRTFLAEKFV